MKNQLIETKKLKDGVIITTERPPQHIEEKALKLFDASFDDTVVFAYGDKIHTIILDIPKDIIVHEKVHLRQQKEVGLDEWWDKYFSDTDFRVDMEAEAYGAQFKYLKSMRRDRNWRFKKLRKLAKKLSGDLYGNAIPMSEAMSIIKKMS